LQGTWVMVSGEMDGKKAADEHVSRSKIIYEGNKIQIVVPNQTPETIVAEIVKIDPTKNPKEMHFVRKNGPNAGKTLIGIYEFEGDGQYKFAFDPVGATTLKEFVTKEGTGHVRNTWKRVKP
ncbi:MAG: TIGR03067 domain-containing protein, partial [Desulfomonilaceae bacterium]